ncbi:hypothetical protein BOO35_19345 [Vibrio navarrensis]|uniref:glycosyltransferase n=1 Tax=Vibrio navarrensis TaxID=29495 RepID=UPI0018668110|nr:glycosyltransferase [Vibrio navarrensis]MBE3667214.1 hypothetical protein [Vibrio navarrensis]
MKIGIFAQRFPILSETFVINQVIEIKKAGVDVSVITEEIDDSNIQRKIINDEDILSNCIELVGKKRNFFTIFKSMGKLVFKGDIFNLISILTDNYLDVRRKIMLIIAASRIDQTISFDTIICHFGVNGYSLCKLRKLGYINSKISVIFHGFDISRVDIIERYQKQYSALFKEADMFLPISHLWERKLIEMGCDRKKIHVQHMGINKSFFNTEIKNTSFQKPIKLLQVGRLTEKKAILNSISAVCEAKESIDLTFNIIGDGELYEEAKKLIRSKNAESYIHLLGAKSSETVSEYLDNTDIFLLPSITAPNGDMEGIPVSIMEAMSKGVYVISTEHSGIPELITNSVHGSLVPENDIQALKDSILNVSNMNYEEIMNIRLNSYKKCFEDFNNETLTIKLLSLLKSNL